MFCVRKKYSPFIGRRGESSILRMFARMKYTPYLLFLILILNIYVFSVALVR